MFWGANTSVSTSSDVCRDPVDERRERLDLATGPELHPLVVAVTAEDDRILCGDQPRDAGVQRVVPAEEAIRGLGNPVEGQHHTYGGWPAPPQGRGSAPPRRGWTLRGEPRLSSGERGEERFEVVEGGRCAVDHAGLNRRVSVLL